MVLVVEHDPEFGQPIVDQLAADAYPARLARTAEHARVLARSRPPMLVVLCGLEPPRDSLDLLKEIRDGDDPWPAILPVIVVGLQASEPDLLRAFEAGADDFIARPANYLELRARLRALVARSGNGSARIGPHVEVGAMVIDHRAHTVSVHGRPVHLRRLEYALLRHLASDPRRVFTKLELMRAIWSRDETRDFHTLDSHASRIRCKLRALGGERWVINVRGVGYRLI